MFSDLLRSHLNDSTRFVTFRVSHSTFQVQIIRQSNGNYRSIADSMELDDKSNEWYFSDLSWSSSTWVEVNVVWDINIVKHINNRQHKCISTSEHMFAQHNRKIQAARRLVLFFRDSFSLFSLNFLSVFVIIRSYIKVFNFLFYKDDCFISRELSFVSSLNREIFFKISLSFAWSVVLEKGD